MSDPAAEVSLLSAQTARMLKGFILGAMLTILFFPQIVNYRGKIVFWGTTTHEVSDSSSPTVTNPHIKQILIPTTYYPSTNETKVTGKAKGCPPSPALCKLSDVFDEIVVLTLPRRTRQFTRFMNQMAALNETVTVIHGVDIKTRVVQSMWDSFKYQKNGYDTIGELAVGFGWLSVLEHVVNIEAERAVVFEDDAIFHLNFPEEFDRRIRKIPNDWNIFYLGSTQFQLWNGEQVEWPPNVEVPDYYIPIYTWGAFAIGFNRAMALSMLAQHAKMDCRIDICTFPNELRRQRGKNYAAYPHIVIADVRYSDLRAGGNIENFAKECRWNLATFDLDNGYSGKNGRRLLRDVVENTYLSTMDHGTKAGAIQESNFSNTNSPSDENAIDQYFTESYDQELFRRLATMNTIDRQRDTSSNHQPFSGEDSNSLINIPTTERIKNL